MREIEPWHASNYGRCSYSEQLPCHDIQSTRIPIPFVSSVSGTVTTIVIRTAAPKLDVSTTSRTIVQTVFGTLITIVIPEQYSIQSILVSNTMSTDSPRPLLWPPNTHSNVRYCKWKRETYILHLLDLLFARTLGHCWFRKLNNSDMNVPRITDRTSRRL